MITKEDLKQYEYFSALSTESLEKLAGKLVPETLPDGTVIISQGTPPDFFYFLQQGEVIVKKRNRFGQRSIVNILSSGQAFGEIALLTCSHRTSTVLAKGKVTLLRMSKKDFEDTIMEDSVFKSVLTKKSKDISTYNKYKTLQPFALLEPEKMATLVTKLKERTYYPGEDVIKQGEEPDYYFIIKSGAAVVIKEKKCEPPKEVARLGAGEGFGEEALIREEKRGATVRAETELVVLALDKKEFNSVLKASFLDFTFPEDIPLDNLGDYVIIDARIPPEYKEEHIEGAINIPLEELRQRYPELEYDNKYITYCTNDSRGMAAAFLLGTQGFKAKNLRGGLSGWEGPTTVGSDGIHYPKPNGATPPSPEGLF